nr:PREDICTED: U3 small nucleolar RNA-associated protein 14 homolog A [Bemisia tabaci]
MGVQKRRRRPRQKRKFEDADDDVPSEKKYDQFTASLRNLDGKKKLQAPTRVEPSFQVSEFHLGKQRDGSSKAKDTVNVQDLAQLLAKKPHLASIHQQFRETQKKSQKLPKPLERTVEKKLKRKVGFTHLKKDLDKWQSVVETNRVADQMKFPLNKEEIEIYDDCDILSTFSKPTPLEEAMAAVLKKSEVAQKENRKHEEKQKKYNLTLKEMIERRKMIAKARAQQSFLAVKAKYQKKIKSKKYHRILRKDKVKQQIKDFEKLKEDDPEAALEQMNQIERVRAAERATLRHRNTGRWAKNMAIRAKYDKESRQVLADQIEQSRSLTQKMQTNSSDESDGEELELEDAADNPWIDKDEKDATNEADKFFSGYRKYWTDKNKDVTEIDINVSADQDKRRNQEMTLDASNKETGDSSGKDKSPKAKKKKSNTWVVKPSINKEVEVKESDKDSSPTVAKSPAKNKSFKANLADFDNAKPTSESAAKKADVNIDPLNIIKVNPKAIKSGFARDFSACNIIDDDEDAEITEDPHLTIAEAFADDDVIGEFRAEKEEENKKSEIPEVEVGMPGWGYWAGHKMQPSQNPRKRRRRIINLPKPPPRLDQNKGRAIIFEEESQSAQAHQIDAIPFPFKSVEDYEKSVRQPVGKVFVPTTASRKLTAPPVVTKLGTVIEPMDSSQLLKTDILKLNK